MRQMRLAFLALILTTTALVAGPAAAHAQSASSATAADMAAVPVAADTEVATRSTMVTPAPGSDSSVRATMGCPAPYLGTGFGPIAQCTVVNGGTGRAGFYSPFTGQFNTRVGPLNVHSVRWYSWNGGTIIGYTSLHTAYGPAVWATQYSGNRGRWGTVNLITSQFYPDSGWMSAA